MRPDGRKFMVIIKDDGSRSTTLYSRYLMEQYLGRELHNDQETVDHINGDKTDDRLDNLQILTRSDHTKKDHSLPELVVLTCTHCGTEFMRRAGRERHNRKQGKTGPFCSKSCVGKVYH